MIMRNSGGQWQSIALVFATLAQLGASIAWPGLAAEQQHALPCELDPQSDDLLRCVVMLINDEEKGKPTAEAVMSGPVRAALQHLADLRSYHGTIADLDELKRRSKDLKIDPSLNRDAIVALDSAIASHASEIGPALSPQSLAESASAGADIYPSFIEQKLAFLADEKRAEFYDRGPFEIVRRTLLANALESTFFLGREADSEKLKREIRILDEALDRLRKPEYAYLERRPQNSRINSLLFWRASLLFLLGDKTGMKKDLREIIESHRQFDITTENIGHIYIYKIFDLPYQMKVKRAGQNDRAEIEVNDPYLLKRYYNPTQLALVACSLLDEAAGHEIQTFSNAVVQLVMSDYYVVAASSRKENSNQIIQQFNQVLNQTVIGDKFRQQRDAILNEVADKEVPGLSAAVKNGARLCEIDDSSRDEIYSPFAFRAFVKRIEAHEAHVDYLLFGGRLNATQASVVADFLNQSFLAVPELRTLREALGMENNAHIARMPMDEK